MIMTELEIETLLPLVSSPVLFFNQLGNYADSEKIKQRNEILIELHDKHDIDLCNIAVNAIQIENTSVYKIINILNDMLFLLTDSVDYLLTYFKLVYEKTKNDLLCYQQFKSLDNIPLERKQFIEEVVSRLSETNEEFAYVYLPNIILKAPFISLENKIDKAQQYITSKTETKRRTGIQLLTSIITDFSLTDDKESECISFLYDITGEHIKDYNAMLVWEWCQIYKKKQDEKIFEEIVNLRKENDPYINSNIVKFLFQNNKLIESDDKIRGLFLSFTDTKCEYIGIINNLDFILMELSKTDSAFAYNFFYRWIHDSDFGTQPESFHDFCKLWVSYINVLTANDNLYKKVLSQFFLAEDEVYRIAAQQLILTGNMCSKTIDLSFDKTVFENCSSDDIKFVLRKLAGYVYLCEPLFSLTYSLIQLYADNEKISQLLYKFATDFLIFEFPKYANTYFNEKLSLKTLPESVQKLINHISKEANKYNQYLQQRKQFKELHAPNFLIQKVIEK